MVSQFALIPILDVLTFTKACTNTGVTASILAYQAVLRKGPKKEKRQVPFLGTGSLTIFCCLQRLYDMWPVEHFVGSVSKSLTKIH
jgi:hypothetical protein